MSKQEISYAHETTDLEISNKEGKMSIFRAETETACSQTEGEGPTKSELTVHVGEPVEPPYSISCLSIRYK